MKTIALACGPGIMVMAIALMLAFGSLPVHGAVTASSNRIVVWDGTGAGWTNPSTSAIQAESTDVHNSTSALEFKYNDDGGRWLGAGWNWLGFKKGAYGVDISQSTFLTFWVKSTGTATDLQINLLCNGTVADTPEHHTDKVHLSAYCPKLSDGTWHLVRIPLTAFAQPQGFDAKHVCEIQLGLMADHMVAGSYVFDDIAFER